MSERATKKTRAATRPAPEQPERSARRTRRKSELPSPAPDRTALGARRAVGGGALLLLVGLGLVGIGPSDAGMAVTLLALVLLLYGIHTFGRLGPDARFPAEAQAEDHAEASPPAR